MATITNTGIAKWKWLHILCAAGLLVSFFFPWVIWDGSKVSGYDMPAGNFFKISGIKFGLDNPFPQFSFAFFVFWIIPLFALLLIFIAGINRKTGIIAYITGVLSLSLATIFILFTKTLIDLGAGSETLKMLQPAIYLHIIAAAGLILTVAAKPVSSALLKKLGWIVVGPVFAFAGYMFTQNYFENQTFQDTANVKTDYTINADQLIKEFITNDTATNKKYLDKTLIVSGKASSVEILADSTSTVKFADSTGSYAIFSLEKNQVEQAKKIKAGDAVSVKGVCSGSIFSEILGTTSISFKRATLNKK